MEEDSYTLASLGTDIDNARASGLRGVLVHLGASWCRPCQRVKPIWSAQESNISKKVLVRDVDIDNSIELFSRLKRARVITGVPASLVYTSLGDTKSPAGLQPADSVLSADPEAVAALCTRILSAPENTKASDHV